MPSQAEITPELSVIEMNEKKLTIDIKVKFKQCELHTCIDRRWPLLFK